MLIKKILRHRRLGNWDGKGFIAPNASTGGCSALGVDSESKFAFVYKATENTGGLYRSMSHIPGSEHQYILPQLVQDIPDMRK